MILPDKKNILITFLTATIAIASVILFISMVSNNENEKSSIAVDDVISGRIYVNLDDYCGNNNSLTGEKLVNLKNKEMGARLAQVISGVDKIQSCNVKVYTKNAARYADVNVTLKSEQILTEEKYDDILRFVESSLGVKQNYISISVE